MKLKVTVGGIAYDVDVEVVEEPKRLSPIVLGGSSSACLLYTSDAADE